MNRKDFIKDTALAALGWSLPSDQLPWNTLNNKNRMSQDDTAEGPKTLPQEVIAAPKGGGAIKGMNDQVRPHPFTGSLDYTVPGNILPGRQGLTPVLDLNYNSANG